MFRGRDGSVETPGRCATRGRRRGLIKRAAGLALSCTLLVAGGQGSAGHQIGHYPSYYPDEIRIDVVDPAAAARGLAEETLHAYVGASPRFVGSPPKHLKAAKSLGSFLVLSFDVASRRFASTEARCAAARGILAEVGSAKVAGFVFHPYPVTPYHTDYLHHLDLVEAATEAVGGSLPSVLELQAKDQLARLIARARAGVGDDVTLEAVPVESLLFAQMRADGSPGMPWAREGWFHAHQLLAPGLEAGEREAVDRHYEQLVRGRARSFAEHTDLERRLVASLVKPCRRLVAGYSVREEYANEKYPEGVENIAYDSLAGLNSPVFIRTVKLKDYPWNGKLHLGVPERSDAAWNPIAGFSDGMGRLVWSGLGHPAMIAFPFKDRKSVV